MITIAPNDTLEVTLALSGEMQIFVKTLIGQMFTIDMNSSDSIALLKIKIWALTGLPPLGMRPVFSGRLLQDERTVASCGLSHESTIQLLLTLRAYQ